MIYESILDTIGNTPLVKLNKVMEHFHLKANLYAKIEARNPGGSIKDRASYNMIKEYEKKGLINKDTILIEPTSGNTGIGLALVCARLGYKFVVCMPETMSKERRMLIAAYGAKLVLTDGKLGMKGAIAKANELKAEYGNAIIVGQFENINNPLAHYYATAPEIDRDLNGNVDILVAGIGTGGTISGVSKYFKERNSNFKAIGVEPKSSPFLTENKAGAHKIQGIGAGFKPETLNIELVDEILTVSNEDAYNMARLLPTLEGILIGISSGASLASAILVASKKENEGKNIVVIFPDSGERYLSTDLFEV